MTKQKDQPEVVIPPRLPTPAESALEQSDQFTLLSIEALAQVVLHRAEGWRDLPPVELDRLDEAYRRLMSVRQIFRDLV